MKRHERTNKISGHESLRKLVIILIIAFPERIFLSVEVLPEPGQGDISCLFVGVLAFPVVES